MNTSRLPSIKCCCEISINRRLQIQKLILSEVEWVENRNWAVKGSNRRLL